MVLLSCSSYHGRPTIAGPETFKHLGMFIDVELLGRELFSSLAIEELIELKLPMMLVF